MSLMGFPFLFGQSLFEFLHASIVSLVPQVKEKPISIRRGEGGGAVPGGTFRPRLVPSPFLNSMPVGLFLRDPLYRHTPQKLLNCT